MPITKYEWKPSQRKWYNPFSWFKKGAHLETWVENEWISKFVDYVDMNEVASQCIVPVQKNLDDNRKRAIKYVKNETERLKQYLEAELVKIDFVLNQKLTLLSNVKAESEAKQVDIARKEQNLKWLEGIQKRVNDIIRF